jgi:acyl-[acyl-carrier-protein]-phospholipid O-acyltransferase/long-chain-fatty-acid--[acyl-carrier-protein] ligase
VGVAIVGWAVSLLIGRLHPANPSRPVPLNPAKETIADLGTLISRRPLLLAALGSSFFWALGTMAQINVDKLARPELVVGQEHVGPLLAILTLGIGAGAVLAGIWSGGRIELGLVPVGAAGMGVASILLYTVPQGTGEFLSAPYNWAALWLTCMGLAAGLFDVPLVTYLQDRSPIKSRGRILAAYNFISFSSMLLAAALFWLLADQRALNLSAREIFLLCGVATLAVAAVIVWLVPAATVRVILRIVFRLVYRVRVEGIENLPKDRGALLLPNHVTWIDGLLLLMFAPRPVRMVVFREYIEPPLLRRMAKEEGAIGIGPGRKSVAAAIHAARKALGDGELVCMFPEGGLTRTGEIQSFQPGFLSVLKKTGAPAIPIHLGGLWGSIFSFERGKFFWKLPRRVPYPVSIRFGQPIENVTEPEQVRQAVRQLESQMMSQTSAMIPARQFLRMCRRTMRREKVADSTGVSLTGASLLTRALILRRLLRREVLAGDERNVGLLLPPSVGTVLANAALSIDSRIAVNLNYTATSEIINDCIAQAGIRHVLSSRRLFERFDLKPDAEVVFLDDLIPKVTQWDKLAGAIDARMTPIGLLERRLGLHKLKPDDVITLIFTSGSVGKPKGVMLTHTNVATNVAAFNEVLAIDLHDVLVGILPLFHSFGYTTTMWTVLMLDPKGVYHYSPLEPRAVGKLAREHAATILVATPTFLRSYLRRCEKEDFASLEVLITGAEKLPLELADAFEEKYGVRPYEGYGTTELSPVVSLNSPPSRTIAGGTRGYRDGTVGQAIPGVVVKTVHLESGADLGPNQEGMLWVKGPNVMKGYLDQPEKTAEVLRDGWYITGDVAVIDRDGFIRITGRQSRFSKIGGEMVPHLRIEEAIGEMIGAADEHIALVVTAVPDVRKGERLVVLHTGLSKPPDEICRELAGKGLPAIWIPSPDSFRQVESIPVLGTGKLDLKRVRDLASELAGENAAHTD